MIKKVQNIHKTIKKTIFLFCDIRTQTAPKRSKQDNNSKNKQINQSISYKTME